MTMRLFSLGIPRCASNYIYEALKPDYNQEHYTFNLPEGLQGHWKPMPKSYDESDTFTVAFVRNPFDLLVSTYEWNRVHENVMKAAPMDKGFKEWLRQTIFEPQVGYPNNKFLFFQMFDGIGRCKVDYVGRVETIDEDLQRVAEMTGRRYTKGNRLNTSNRKLFNDYYDSESEQWVAIHYIREFSIFGYSLLDQMGDFVNIRALLPNFKGEVEYDWATDKLTIEKNV